MMQVRMDSSIRDRFWVDSATGSGERYQVDLESGDWDTGAHTCTCPDQQRHPGRWCKHIRWTLQRVAGVLPTAIQIESSRYNLDGFTYRSDQANATHARGTQFSAASVFYCQMGKFDAFYSVIQPPANHDQIAAGMIARYHGSTLALIQDQDASAIYVRAHSSRETLAVFCDHSVDAVLALCAPLTWYPMASTYGAPLRNGRYVEYRLSHEDQSSQIADMQSRRHTAAARARAAVSTSAA